MRIVYLRFAQPVLRKPPVVKQSLRGWQATCDMSHSKQRVTTGRTADEASPSTSDQPAEQRLWHVFQPQRHFPRAADPEFAEPFPAVRKIQTVPILS